MEREDMLDFIKIIAGFFFILIGFVGCLCISAGIYPVRGTAMALFCTVMGGHLLYTKA